MQRFLSWPLLFYVFATVFLASQSQAQPFTLDEKIKPTELTLADYKSDDGRANGRIVQSIFTQTEPVQYFFVKGISIYSPDYVGITAADRAAGIQMSLHKEIWDQAHRQGHTDAEGHWETTFKTSGDFGIKVTPDKLPATYSLIVWVGKEIDPQLPSPFVAAVAGGGSSWTAIYAVAGIVAAILIIFFFRSKSKTTAAACLVGFILVTPVSLTAQADLDLKKAMDYFKKLLDLEQNSKKMWDDSKTLSPGESAPDMSQRGPTMPTSCADKEGSEECRCFAAAAERLNKNRLMLEKLRILVANQKDFKDKAVALGNSYAQLHTLMGIQWVGIRTHDIDEPYAQFKVISNQKHQDVMAAVEASLKQISDCEAKLGEKDWYQKYGFVYYEFLYDAYKPSF